MVVTPKAPAGAAELLETLRTYLPADRVESVNAALEFARECHEGQKRLSGEPYITHPIAVAQLVAGLRMDAQTVRAALLHDVIEDCGITSEDLSRRFGPDVTRLVEGATKIEQIPAPPGVDAPVANADAETLRKMFLAMAEDVRVVIIKLADRLHNMRTLEHLPPERQHPIARETMDIYAPLASRLGIWQFKWELEDLAFRYVDPEGYRRTAEMVSAKRSERERYVRRVESELRGALEEAGVEAEVTGRVKHLYSIYDKSHRYSSDGKSIDQIHDLLALRVLVKDVADCYNALGIVHQTWRPIPNSFDDYIANPKESLYQSLHTSVLGPGTRPFEVQIRTYEMHEVAEYGVAAHWQYKEEPRKRDLQYEERMAWLRHLIEWQQESPGAEDFLESVKTDVFRDQVFVYTPRGDVRVLPAGCTPVDFAYRVHTDLGHNTTGAKVNGRLVPLTTRLQNGDIVEILRSKASKGPSRDWLIPSLGYLGSSHSRQKVRQWFRRQQRGENVDRGRELVDREMRRLDIDRVPVDLWKQLGYETAEDAYSAIGSGDVSPQKLLNRLAEHAPAPTQPKVSPATVKTDSGAPGVRVLGQGGLHVMLAKCCRPVFGDPIIGYVTRARGVTVHRRDCRNVRRPEESDRYVECDWGPSGDLYSAAVEVHAWDRVGLMRDISTIVAADGANMVGVHTEEHDDRSTTVHLTIETEGGAQFARLLSHLDAVRAVISVRRVGSG
ncbi:MAG: RelA/SpoT family protein [Dehalococcoidia bacterium]|nr:RelA/SpoT family protein [Dehalococcoidia bacterium]